MVAIVKIGTPETIVLDVFPAPGTDGPARPDASLALVIPGNGTDTADTTSITAGAGAIEGGITLSIAGAISAAQTITFAGTGGVLAVADAIDMAGTVAGFDAPDTIDLTGAAYDPTAVVSLKANNLLVVTELSGTYNVQLDHAQFFPSEIFVASPDLGTGTDINLVQIPIGGYVAIPSGEYANGLIVGSSGEADVLSTATLNGGTIGSGGLLLVENFGTANAVTIGAGGTGMVRVQGTAGDDIINGNGLLDLTSGGAGIGSINFGAVGGTLQIDDTIMPSATVYGFAPGDTIDLETIPAASIGTIVPLLGNTLAIIANTQTYYIQFDPAQNFANEVFTPSADSGSGSFITESNVTCFLGGTLIETRLGEVIVEELAIGDLVRTQFAGLAPVTWLGYRQVACDRHPKPEQVWPIRVIANAFGPGRPYRDLWLSPDHSVFINTVLIPIKYLVNGTTIAQVHRRAVTYYHIELQTHDVLLAQGLPAESYLDTGDRGNFANGGDPIALHPDFTSRVWEAEGCAPLIVTGPQLAAAQSWVDAVANRCTRDVATAGA